MRDATRLELPVGLIVAAFFLITAFQTERLVQEHSSLAALRTQQEATLEQADRIRARFQMVAGGVTKLAQSGNANAKAVLDQLQAQGITVRPTAPKVPSRPGLSRPSPPVVALRWEQPGTNPCAAAFDDAC
jgi:hypothetical protein